MKDGCIHNQVQNTCNMYGYLCNGNADNKLKCPIWGEAVAAETYFSERLNRETIMEAVDEEYLQELYEKGKKSLAYQVNANTIDWKAQKSFFGFKKESDARKYILSKLREERLIECKNCHSRADASGFCRHKLAQTAETDSCREFLQKHE